MFIVIKGLNCVES